MNEKKKLIMILTVIIVIVMTVLIALLVTILKSHSIRKNVENLYNGSEINILYLGRDNCSYCQLFSPIIESVSKKYQFDYHFVDTNKLTDKDLIKILNTLDVDINNFGTPYVAIVQNGKKISEQSGYANESDLFMVLQESGIIAQDEINPYVASDDDEVVKSFINILNSSTKKLVYIGRPTCTYCQKLTPILEEVSTEYNIDYYYVNTDEIESNELSAILYKLEKKSSTFGTPYLAVVQKGEKIGESSGYIEKEKLVDFIKEKGLVEE